MANGIPIVGWLIAFVINVSLAIPFWICWTCCGLGAHYFNFLPSQFHVIPFWHCVGLFTILGILKCFLPSARSSAEIKDKATK